MLEGKFNTAIRGCIDSHALKSKVPRLTEQAQLKRERLKSRQILWLIFDYLKASHVGDQSFRLVELSARQCHTSSRYADEECLERFLDKWDHLFRWYPQDAG